jgi:uncharacterized RDD family membrane protein YckC
VSEPSTAGPAGEEPSGAPDRLPNASFVRRLAALAYELLLLTAIILPVGFLTIPLAAPVPGGPRAPAIPAAPGRVLSACLVFAAAGAYFTWCWSGGRRTLPMKTWGLQFERRDGRPVDIRTAVVRYVSAWLGPLAALLAFVGLEPFGSGAHAAWLVALNFLWALVDPERQFLHDRIAGTRIVRARR